MANVKISALPAATSVASADVLPIVQSATTKKATIQNVSDALGVTSTVANVSPGLVYVTGATFSAVSGVSVNSCFTTTSVNYRVYINIDSASANGTAYVRLRASGTDNTTNNYYYAYTTLTSTNTAGTHTYAGNNNWNIGYSRATTIPVATVMDIFNPQTTVRTSATLQTTGDNAAHTSWVMETGGALFDGTTQFDGFSVYIDTGTITGRYAVYQYRQA